MLLVLLPSSLQAKNLPGMDWWNGLADPYVIITALPPGEQGIQYT
jgi:hypothetical protein